MFHPISHDLLDKIAAHAPHALLISGEVGIGLQAAAQYIAALQDAKPVVVLPEKDGKVDTDKGTITVDIVRRLYDQTRTKTTQHRVIVIDQAERMSPGAQNAFLKLLEEPAGGVQFIILSHEPTSLLPTVRSRAQHITLRRITPEQSIDFLDKLNVSDATKRQQLLFIAQGLPAELTRLVQDSEYFEKRASILRDARSLLQSDKYTGLVLAQQYAQKRPESLVLVNDACELLRRSLKQAANTTARETITTKLAALEQVYDQLHNNGNVRLVLASAVL